MSIAKNNREKTDIKCIILQKYIHDHYGINFFLIKLLPENSNLWYMILKKITLLNHFKFNDVFYYALWAIKTDSNPPEEEKFIIGNEHQGSLTLCRFDRSYDVSRSISPCSYYLSCVFHNYAVLCTLIQARHSCSNNFTYIRILFYFLHRFLFL